ncbi:MAG: TadE/TadG family type IV pilus assembly protein [Pseudomonadota bacterium]
MVQNRHWHSIRRSGACFLRKRDGEHAAGTVEFALILPFILLMIVAIIEMSNLYFMRNMLSEITRDATRRFAVGALEKADVEAFVLKRLAETSDVTGTVNVAETEVDGITDVTLSLSVPFADVLLFDELVEKLWTGGPQNISVNATMMKH